ncbi:MAG: hypothetical protein ACTHMI_08345 [Mucilaginibacter sp.]
MMTLPSKLKCAAVILLLTTTTVIAQNKYKTRHIGNKPRDGSANSSFDLRKGNQVGVKMNIGHKPVQLLKFHFDVENGNSDSLRFKVNVYRFNDDGPQEKLFTQDIYGAAPKGKSCVNIDLEPYHLQAKGAILVAIESLADYGGDNHFPVGILNGGTWTYKDSHWKKIPVVGVDFNMLVRKI